VDVSADLGRARRRSRPVPRARRRRRRGVRAAPPGRTAMPDLSGLEPVEPSGGPPAGGSGLRCHRAIDRDGGRAARRLRLGSLPGRADRDPDHRRLERPAEGARVVRLRRRERPRPVSHPAGRSHRGRLRPARDRRRPRPLPAVRAVRAAPSRGWLARGLRSDLEPALEPAAAGGLDVGGRGRSADPARARALRRGRARADRPRAALHGGADSACLRLSGAALRQRPGRSGTCRRWDSPYG